jgi:hypothetical protein
MLGAAALASAQEGHRELPAFGMLGLSRGQVAVLNLVVVGQTTADDPPCQVTASFVDAAGQLFHDAAGQPVQETFLLRPDVAAELRLRAEDILGERERRKSTRAVLSRPADDRGPSKCPCLMASREILNANGRTVLSDYGQRPPGGGNPPPPFCFETP